MVEKFILVSLEKFIEMKNSAQIIVILLFIVGCTSSQKKDDTTTKGVSKPNIVFIFADDLGWADVGGAVSSSGYVCDKGVCPSVQAKMLRRSIHSKKSLGIPFIFLAPSFASYLLSGRDLTGLPKWGDWEGAFYRPIRIKLFRLT